MARLASVPVALETIRVFLPVVFPPVVKEQCLFLVLSPIVYVETIQNLLQWWLLHDFEEENNKTFREPIKPVVPVSNRSAG